MVLIEIEPCGVETMRVIGQAEDYVKKNRLEKGQIWCVYDKDSFPAERFNELGLGKYAKNMTNIFDILLEKGNPMLAIRYAKRIIKDHEGQPPTMIAPGTKVYELIEELTKYLP